MSSSIPTREQVLTALAGVNDPEIGRPITDLGMVKSIEIGDDGFVAVGIYLTVPGCPMRDTITSRVTNAVTPLSGVTSVRVELDVMSDEQRKDLQIKVRGNAVPDRVIPFAQPTSLTKVYAIVSGKGGVGKSSVTVNLAAALAGAGHRVGLIDADIYGHSVPRMLGTTGVPTKVQDMIMPPVAKDVKVISAGMLKPPGQDALPFRGPILHRLLEQFLADFFWGDLDYLIIDMPPGTGDVALSLARLIPGAELVIVTTPQLAAAEVAKRAGTLVTQTHQRVVGVIENMSYLLCPHCGESMEVFGSGGGETVSSALTQLTGVDVPLLGQIPLDVRLRESGDGGTPLVLADPTAPAAIELTKVAESLASRGRELAGRMLGISPQ
ncbi:MAG: Mrp/NBP35 family ATP-binding protein [Trebonia sp.]